ncbi:hypothetical protein MNBD_ALPHA09-1545 [hydrothermal vent metagenome]|uniref:EamA domain-containing protein n=1 Tax=hydrothermal vent metagenome TaxID=652676 RepID=A0A3B0TR48_9ZZZZ
MTVINKAQTGETPLLGIALLVFGVALAAGTDAIAKYLGADLTVAQIVWGRYVFGLLPLIPFIFAHMGPGEIRRYLGLLELLRAGSMLAMAIFYFSAIQYMPLADALGLLFLYPLLAAGLAVLFLGERISAVFVGLSVISFIGALMVIRPGYGEVNLGAIFAALAALAVAISMVINRKLAGRTPVFAGMVVATVFGLVISTPVVPFFWVVPNLEQWALLAAVGFSSTLVTWMLFSAFLHGPASVIAPFGYSEIVAATALGYFIFGDFPDGWALTGIVVICLAGIVMAMRKGG